MEYALRGKNTFILKQMLLCLNPCFNGICSQRRWQLRSTPDNAQVLILVLMEYALRDATKLIALHKTTVVLILVLMEYALRGSDTIPEWFYCGRSLNPCFNGICSQRLIRTNLHQTLMGLNPCFNGICSQRKTYLIMERPAICLNPCFNGICSQRT